jgi:hypothetical protein
LIILNIAAFTRINNTAGSEISFFYFPVAIQGRDQTGYTFFFFSNFLARLTISLTGRVVTESSLK